MERLLEVYGKVGQNSLLLFLSLCLEYFGLFNHLLELGMKIVHIFGYPRVVSVFVVHLFMSLILLIDGSAKKESQEP